MPQWGHAKRKSMKPTIPPFNGVRPRLLSQESGKRHIASLVGSRGNPVRQATLGWGMLRHCRIAEIFGGRRSRLKARLRARRALGSAPGVPRRPPPSHPLARGRAAAPPSAAAPPWAAEASFGPRPGPWGRRREQRPARLLLGFRELT